VRCFATKSKITSFTGFAHRTAARVAANSSRLTQAAHVMPSHVGNHLERMPLEARRIQSRTLLSEFALCVGQKKRFRLGITTALTVLGSVKSPIAKLSQRV
jgi:hypothetical protein